MGEALQGHLPVHRRRDRGGVPDKHRLFTGCPHGVVSRVPPDHETEAALGPPRKRGSRAMSRRVAGPEGKLAVDDDGSGDAIVLVHSLAGNTRHWSGQLDHLRKSRRAVALDLRGHGKSEAPRNGEYSIEAQAEDVGAVADALGLERFALVGHSMGAGVALGYAGAHPERVTHLLLADPVGDGTQTP